MSRAGRVDLYPHQLDEILRGEESRRFFGAVGREVRDRARANAKTAVSFSGTVGTRRRDSSGRFKASVADPSEAIISVPGEDSESLYVDVGYSKHHPGFYLWWWEVGTVNHAARPHLRPALLPRG
ncbi:hypothetical protein JNUCC0626_18200 [Lentzea sp. JNUCC 0626]|uniref:hypothetical protein n=1 Tax=Lentzea sp. JNUCC 0626 TaxID=3367513 RepID=UPI003749410C